MEAVRRTIDSSLLRDIISLPEDFQNKKVEIIIFLTEERTTPQHLSKSDIDIMLKGSVTESLIGILPNSDISLEEYRLERLGKYERID
jgi:hypothetical protein